MVDQRQGGQRIGVAVSVDEYGVKARHSSPPHGDGDGSDITAVGQP